MACSCGDFTGAAGRQFDAKTAAAELRGYRRGQVSSTTRLLRDGLVRSRLHAGSLLDVGAGIGALTFELLDRGVVTATVVEASQAYLDAAGDEAVRRNRAAAVSLLHGDLVALADRVPAADVVTLDRVVCCYADYRALLGQATRHALHGLALSYPRDRWFVRLGVRTENALRRWRSPAFRTFVHPVEDLQRVIRDAGFELVARSLTPAWAAEVYARRPAEVTATAKPGLRRGSRGA